MSDKSWSWDEVIHSNVMGVLAAPADDLPKWCNRLETAPTDAVVGKVLCVCGAVAIAQKLIANSPETTSEEEDILELLNQWINNPTDERWEHICNLLEDEKTEEFGPYGVLWWALRTATSSVGNYEAAWALASTCGAAEAMGYSSEDLCRIVERELCSRQRLSNG